MLRSRPPPRGRLRLLTAGTLAEQHCPDGSHYSGTGGSNLQILNVQTNDTGGYFAIATNIGGSATSSVATVSVLLPPSITSQPANQAQTQGSSAVLLAAVAGSPPLSYEWLYNGNPLADGGQISGATTTTSPFRTFNLPTVAFMPCPSQIRSDLRQAARRYSPCSPLRRLLCKPTNQITLQGSNVLLSTAAIGSQPIGYRWFFTNAPLSDDTRISGSGTASLVITNAQTNDAGGYFVIATNAYGAATSSIANLSILLPVVIAQQPSNQTWAVGSTFALNVAADGTGPFGYQWYFNNAPLTDNTRISGSTTSSLTVSNAQTSDTGSYKAVVTNLLSSATSATASVSVLVPPRHHFAAERPINAAGLSRDLQRFRFRHIPARVSMAVERNKPTRRYKPQLYKSFRRNHGLWRLSTRSD